MKKYLLLILTIMLSLTLSACGKSKNDVIQKVSGTEARQIIEANENTVIIDVRTLEEYNTAHIENAINIPVDEIEDITDIILNKSTPLIVYCRSGNRSSQAADTLKDLGYTKIYDLGAKTNWDK